MSTQPLPIRWRLTLRDDEQPSRSAKLLGLTLATYADNQTGSTFVGLRTLARNCGFSVDTARRAHHELRRLKYLDVTPRPGLTGISTLRLPLAPMQGVPLAPVQGTPSTRATRTLNNSEGGAVNGRPSPSFALDECAGCNQIRPLVQRDLYCGECASE